MGSTSEGDVSVKEKYVKEISSLIVGIAILSLIGLAFFIIYMLRYISAGELEWTRAVYLLTAVEAVSFAAAGYLFGKDVNRVRAEKAEEEVKKCQGIAFDAYNRAAEAEKRAVKAETKGRSLASLVETKAKTVNNESQVRFFAQDESSSDPYTISFKNNLDELASFAAEQFPK